MAPKKQATTNRAARAAVQRLESLQRAGVTHISRGRAVGAKAAATSPTTEAAQPRPTTSEASCPATAAAAPQVAPADDRAAALAFVARKVAACVRCAELARTRTQTVFGVGNPYARLAFLGEAPGADEDRLGEPFVGRAGQLLDKIIAACGLRREEVYILNILRCRPPGNRTPLPTEAANCREWLDAQLAIIQAEFVCCLGACAAQNLLGTTETIGRLRGRVIEHQGRKVVCTYHPSYLLRAPEMKRATWEDMQLLMAEMGLKIPGK